MFLPSPDAVAAVAAYVLAHGGWTQDDATILAALNAPSIANPVPAEKVQKPYGIFDLFGLLSDASWTNLIPMSALLIAVREDLNIQAYDRVAEWAYVAYKAGAIVPADFQAITTALSGPGAQIDDPSYSAQVSWASVTLGRDAQIGDVIAAHDAAGAS